MLRICWVDMTSRCIIQESTALFWGPDKKSEDWGQHFSPLPVLANSYGFLSRAVATVKGEKEEGRETRNGLVQNLRAPRELRLAEVGNHTIQPVIAANPSFFSR